MMLQQQQQQGAAGGRQNVDPLRNLETFLRFAASLSGDVRGGGGGGGAGAMRPPPPQGASAHDISTLPTRKWQRPAPTSPAAAADSDRNKCVLRC